MSLTDQLKDVFSDPGIACGGKLYSLDELKTVAAVEGVGRDCWLATRERDGWLDFLLGQFSMSNTDGSETRFHVVFQGNGSIDMREPRHIWWGPDGNGYTFYLPGKEVRLALELLDKYFDF